MGNATRPIDLRHCGPIIDRDGDIDYRQQFEDLLSSLFKRKRFPKKRRKVLFEVSIICKAVPDYPKRDTITCIRTFSYLCRQYEKWYGEPFNLEEVKERKNLRWVNYEKEAQRRAAWGTYSNYVHLSNQQERQQKLKDSIKDLSSEEQKKHIEDFKKDNFGTLLIG